MIGAGKYDNYCSEVRLANLADAVALIVINGRYGSGFSVQGTRTFTEELPALLRHMADQIEKDMKEPTYKIIDNGRAITCLLCNSTSWNRNDVTNLYCGRCHIWHERREA